MKISLFKTLFIIILAVSFSLKGNAQQGSVTINQDQEITKLIALKKKINSEERDADRYKIQIYFGNRSGADSAERKYKSAFSTWSSKKVYETPNYKIWVGSFRTKLQADRALLKIQKEFPNAFKFQPPKN